MAKKSQKQMGMVLFLTFTAFVVAAATTTLELSPIGSESRQQSNWKNVSTPKEMMGKDQWYTKGLKN